jgi:hypothetical protein
MLLHRDEDIVKVLSNFLRDVLNGSFHDSVKFFFADFQDAPHSGSTELALGQKKNGRKNEPSS